MSFQELSDFKYIEGGRNLSNGGFTRNEMMELTEVREWRAKHQNTGLYLTAYIYDNEDVKEANLYGDFYLDFDSEEDFEKAREDAIMAAWYLKQFTYRIPEEFLRIYFSGKKGLHIVVPAEVFGIKPDKRLNEYFKVMAQKVEEQLRYKTLDTGIYDRRRLFRAPNSRHNDTKLFKIPLSYDELKNMPLEEIKKKAQMPQPLKYPKAYEISRAKAEFQKHMLDWENRFGKKFDNKKRFADKPLDFTPACIQEILATGPVKGQRNNTAAALTSVFKKQAKTEQEAWDELVKWNNDSINERELKMAFESVWEGGYEYGCSTFEDLATCIGGDCPLFSKRKDK